MGTVSNVIGVSTMKYFLLIVAILLIACGGGDPDDKLQIPVAPYPLPLSETVDVPKPHSIPRDQSK